jgi:hypothetical protein
VLGVGLGLFTPPNTSAIMGSAPANRLGTAGGILNMTRSLGTSLGVALTGATLTFVLTSQSSQHVGSTLDVPPALLQAVFHQTLLFLAAMATLAAVCSTVRGPTELRPVPTKPTRVAESVGI